VRKSWREEAYKICLRIKLQKSLYVVKLLLVLIVVAICLNVILSFFWCYDFKGLQVHSDKVTEEREQRSVAETNTKATVCTLGRAAVRC